MASFRSDISPHCTLEITTPAAAHPAHTLLSLPAGCLHLSSLTHFVFFTPAASGVRLGHWGSRIVQRQDLRRDRRWHGMDGNSANRWLKRRSATGGSEGRLLHALNGAGSIASISLQAYAMLHIASKLAPTSVTFLSLRVGVTHSSIAYCRLERARRFASASGCSALRRVAFARGMRVVDGTACSRTSNLFARRDKFCCVPYHHVVACLRLFACWRDIAACRSSARTPSAFGHLIARHSGLLPITRVCRNRAFHLNALW